MPVHLVSYDLHNQRSYQPVWDLLGRLRGKRLLESVWIVNSSHNAGQLRDLLNQVIDNDDSVAVVELGPGINRGTRRRAASRC